MEANTIDKKLEQLQEVMAGPLDLRDKMIYIAIGMVAGAQTLETLQAERESA